MEPWHACLAGGCAWCSLHCLRLGGPCEAELKHAGTLGFCPPLLLQATTTACTASARTGHGRRARAAARAAARPRPSVSVFMLHISLFPIILCLFNPSLSLPGAAYT